MSFAWEFCQGLTRSGCLGRELIDIGDTYSGVRNQKWRLKARIQFGGQDKWDYVLETARNQWRLAASKKADITAAWGSTGAIPSRNVKPNHARDHCSAAKLVIVQFVNASQINEPSLSKHTLILSQTWQARTTEHISAQHRCERNVWYQKHAQRQWRQGAERIAKMQISMSPKELV
jgi:hypothetical protein